MTQKVLLLPGDGIGPEQTEQAVRVIDFMNKEMGMNIEVERALLGGAAIDQTGMPLPQKTLDLGFAADAILKAPIGGKKWESLPRDQKPEAGLLKARKTWDLFGNLRPAVMAPELIDSSSLKSQHVQDLDVMVVRELSSGAYFGKSEIGFLPNGEEYAFDTTYYKQSEIERIMRMAFEIAQKRSNKLCSVDKANVMSTGILWRKHATRIGLEYPNVKLDHMYVDNASMQLGHNPKQFDVLVMENTFGDILSDQASMLTGSIGMLPSASLGPINANGKRVAMYEPIHGSAPDIAGKGIANPISMLYSLGMMLEFSFNRKDLSDLLTTSVRGALNKGNLTKDLVPAGAQYISTRDMGDAIINELRVLSR